MYLLLLGEDPLAEADRLLVLVHLVVFFVHPLVVGVGVQHPLSVNLQGEREEREAEPSSSPTSGVTGLTSIHTAAAPWRMLGLYLSKLSEMS